MSRLPPDRFTWPWGEAQTCPCGSNIPFGDCCHQGPRKLPHVRVPDLMPPEPTTGHAHPRCYMSPSRNCSSKISREHYISQAILDQFPVLTVSGLPWQQAGEAQQFTPRALTANILCTRHNSALSPLDMLAARAFAAFVDAPRYALERTTPGKAQHYLVSGDALELWMLKLLAGLYFGGIASANTKRLRESCTIRHAELVDALSGRALPGKAGLYLAQGVGEVPKRALGVAPLIDTATEEAAGVRVQFGTLLFETLLVPAPDEAFRRMTALRRRRPGIIDISGSARDARIVMSWQHQGNQVDRLGIEIAV